MQPRPFLSPALPVLIGLLVLAPASRAATVTVQVSASVICVHGSTGATLASFSGTRVVTWDDADVVVRCDGDGVEPRDLSATDSSVTIPPARTVTLRLPDAQALAVEWIAIEDEGPRFVAKRSFDPRLELKLPVAKDERRWLRVRRGDSSPMTLSVPTGDDAVINVPEAISGGEIFARIPEREFMPKSMATFPHTGIAPVSDRFFALHGVPPGNFTLRGIYEGELVQHIPERVIVRKGESTWIDAKKVPVVGAVQASVSPDLCTDTGTVIIIGDGKALAERRIDPGSCSLRWEGVPPGKVPVRFRSRAEGIVASETANVIRDRVSEVLLVRNTPLVHGRVLLGDDPAADVRISFARGRDRVDAVSEFDGRYEVHLPEAGAWSIGSSIWDYGSVAIETHEFAAGEQQYDIELPPGRFRVTVEARNDDRGVAQLIVRGPRNATTPVRTHEEIDVRGLPLGSYSLEATAPGSGISDRITVELTEDSPSAEVTLELEPHEIVVKVITPEGTPLSGASISGGGRLFKEREPGIFRLTELREGHVLKIEASGREPVCGAARSPESTFVLRPAGPHAARFQAKGGDVWFELRGFLGSDCWFNRHDLDWRRLRDGFEITGLNAGTYQLRIGGRTVTFAVPGPPVNLDAE